MRSQNIYMLGGIVLVIGVGALSVHTQRESARTQRELVELKNLVKNSKVKGGKQTWQYGDIDNWLFPGGTIRPITSSSDFTVPADSILVITNVYCTGTSSYLRIGTTYIIRGRSNYQAAATDPVLNLHLPIFVNSGELVDVTGSYFNGYLFPK